MSRDQRLDDLAVLYVGLAHGIDGRMHFNEFTQIADHLVRWKSPADERDVLDLVDAAVADSSPESVRAAVARLGHVLSFRERSAIMEDLSEIALADRKFLREEARYIVGVAQSWGVSHLHDEEGAFASVLRAATAGL